MNLLYSKLLILTFVTSNVYCQDSKFSLPIMENQMRIATEYLVDDVAGDTILHVKEYYNKSGYRTKIEIYQRDTIQVAYEYKYWQDSILAGRRVSRAGNLVSIGTYTGNPPKKFVSYAPNSNRIWSRAQYEYNSDKSIRESKIFYRDILQSHFIYLYHKNGNLKSIKKIEYDEFKRKHLSWDDRIKAWYRVVKISKPNSKSERKRVSTEKYDKFGKIQNPDTQTFEIIEDKQIVNHDGWPKMRSLEFKLNEHVYLIGKGGGTMYSKGSVIRQISFSNIDGLIELETEYLNNKKTASKIIKYKH